MRSLEHRTIKGLTVEQREGASDAFTLVGYAARFDSLSKNLGGFKEKIAPGAFSRSLAAGDDCKGLFNHDANLILSRRESGTLEVTEDANGLKFRMQLNPNSTMHRDVYEAVKRGDITECSFAFTINGDEGESWEPLDGMKDEDGFPILAIRTLKDLNLVDVSVVTYPAYNTTNASARAAILTPEIRTALAKLEVEGRAKGTKGEESFEDRIYRVQAAVCESFPQRTEQGAPTGYCRFWCLETFENYVIVLEWGSSPAEDTFYKIVYSQTKDGEIKFGDPIAVEKQWVKSERADKAIAEQRAKRTAEAPEAPAQPEVKSEPVAEAVVPPVAEAAPAPEANAEEKAKCMDEEKKSKSEDDTDEDEEDDTEETSKRSAPPVEAPAPEAPVTPVGMSAEEIEDTLNRAKALMLVGEV